MLLDYCIFDIFLKRQDKTSIAFNTIQILQLKFQSLDRCIKRVNLAQENTIKWDPTIH
jgi:FtsZ-binding cell division protein ZapB